MYFKVGALKNLGNFTGKIYLLESLFVKASGPHVCKLIKKRLQHRYFPVKLGRFQEHFFYRTPPVAGF